MPLMKTAMACAGVKIDVDEDISTQKRDFLNVRSDVAPLLLLGLCKPQDYPGKEHRYSWQRGQLDAREKLLGA